MAYDNTQYTPVPAIGTDPISASGNPAGTIVGNTTATGTTTTGYLQIAAVQSDNARAREYQGVSLLCGQVYNVLFNAALTMEERLAESLDTYQKHPDIQANLQQLQYDLQQWNLTLTTMSNINKNFGDGLKSIASNFR